jgi:hypothetical protein
MGDKKTKEQKPRGWEVAGRAKRGTRKSVSTTRSVHDHPAPTIALVVV